MFFKSSKEGKMLREASEKKRLTQEVLAYKVSKKRRYYSRNGNDEASINLKTLLKIVEV
jgi:hypothetical protein